MFLIGQSGPQSHPSRLDRHRPNHCLLGFPNYPLWPDLAWIGLVWPGLAWLGLVWPGLAWFGFGIPRPAHADGLRSLENPSETRDPGAKWTTVHAKTLFLAARGSPQGGGAKHTQSTKPSGLGYVPSLRDSESHVGCAHWLGQLRW